MEDLDPVQRVEEFISKHGIVARIEILEPESARTSLLASQALGCSIAEIAKTIVFMNHENSEPILVILSGDKKVNLEKLAGQIATTASALRKMTANEVKEQTGYAIGGVPPFPHKVGTRVFADNSLFRFESIWAAAGGSNAVVQLKPSVFIQLGIPQIDASE